MCIGKDYNVFFALIVIDGIRKWALLPSPNSRQQSIKLAHGLFAGNQISRSVKDFLQTTINLGIPRRFDIISRTIQFDIGRPNIPLHHCWHIY